MGTLIFIGICVALAIASLIAAFTVKVQTENPEYDRYSRNEGIARTVPATWPRLAGFGAAVIFTLIAGIIWLANTFYTQEFSEANVVKSADGRLLRAEVEPGWHTKAPWETLENWDILGQQSIYKADGKPTSEGEVVRGPQIQVQTKGGASADVDVAIRWSILKDKVLDNQNEFRSQTNFEARLIDQDIRSVVRAVPAAYTPTDLRQKRPEVEAKIVEALNQRWAGKYGVQVSSVALQGIRFPQNIEEGFNRVQEGQLNIQSEQAKLDAAKVTAQQKIVSAEAEAKANKILDSSLTDKILQQRGMDTLKEVAAKGNVIITDGKSIPMVNVAPAK